VRSSFEGQQKQNDKEAGVDSKDVYQKCSQSLWLDYIRRHLLDSDDFARLVREDGIRGVTSNPSIFEKAISGSTDYHPALEDYEQRKDETASAIYEHLAIEDIRHAADILRPVYEGTVSPLASSRPPRRAGIF
jgi:transaldolase/glucose-6-phosphate isomerase